VKDAVIPSLIGTALLVSMRSREPLMKTMFYNDTLMDVPRVDAALRERGNGSGVCGLLRRCTALVAGAMFASAALGFFLAHYCEKSGGTAEFNAEFGEDALAVMAVIVLPSMVMMMSRSGA